MSDFLQNGAITTIHNLANRGVEEMEKELLQFRKQGSPMVLVLPCLYSELEGPALSNIVDELAKVTYLEEIIIGLDRATKEQFLHAKEYFARLPQSVKILWNDGPRLRALDNILKQYELAPEQEGKGRNVWYCLGYFLAADKGKTVALHDCDILTYTRELPARLFYPVAHPVFGFKFCKGYYFRAAQGKLNGRVCRLLVAPLLEALKLDTNDPAFLEYMAGFRYPLAGEFSMYIDVVRTIRIPSDWGLEVGVLSEVYRNYSMNRICQVDIADAYDHKHQDLSAANQEAGLSKMSIDISKALFRKLATTGEVFTPEKFRTLKASYYRMALDYLDKYYADAVFNGLTLDRHKEENAIELFAQNLMTAGDMFLNNPMETPFMPSWNRVRSAIPDIGAKLLEAVEADGAGSA